LAARRSRVVRLARSERAPHPYRRGPRKAVERCDGLPHRRAPASRAGPADRLAPVRLLRGQDELEAAAEAGLAADVEAAAERDRELARDREPEPGAAAVARPERPEDALALLGRD